MLLIDAGAAPDPLQYIANRLSRESQGRSAGSWCRDRSNSLARDTTRLRSPIRSISGSALRQDSPAVLFRQNCVLPTPLGAMMPTPRAGPVQTGPAFARVVLQQRAVVASKEPQFLALEETWHPAWRPGYAVEFWCLSGSIGHAPKSRSCGS